mmetsp:Transcript_52727/g.120155  ORF Transcript_52727/g.120155 Transcript_52727/m.120155 type:complete len:201 (-) Transcript_52727:276-878(-)
MYPQTCAAWLFRTLASCRAHSASPNFSSRSRAIPAPSHMEHVCQPPAPPRKTCLASSYWPSERRRLPRRTRVRSGTTAPRSVTDLTASAKLSAAGPRSPRVWWQSPRTIHASSLSSALISSWSSKAPSSVLSCASASAALGFWCKCIRARHRRRRCFTAKGSAPPASPLPSTRAAASLAAVAAALRATLPLTPLKGPPLP